MNILKFSSIQLFLFVFFKFNSLIAAEPPPFNNIVLHKNPIQVSQVKFKDFSLKDIQINKNDGNIKILNFWATWCGRCKNEMPSLDVLHAKYSNVLVFPINLEKPNKKRTSQVFKDLNIQSLKIYFDPEFKLAKQLKVKGVPTTILLNKNGNEFARIVGEVDFYDERFLKWLNQFS